MKSNSIFRAIFLGCLFLTPLLFIPILAEQFETPKLFLIWLTAGSLLGCVSFKNLKDDLIGMGLLAFLFSTILSTLFSMSPRMSVFGLPQCPNGVFTTLGYVVLYFGVKEFFCDLEYSWKAFKMLVLAGGVSSVYALCQYWGIDFITWKGEFSRYSTMRPASTMGHPNFLAAYLVTVLPLVDGKKWGAWALRILFVSVIILAESRAAWVTLVAISLYDLNCAGLKKWVTATLCCIAGLVPFICGFIANHVLDSVRFPLLFSLTSRAASIYQFTGARAEYLKTAWRIFKEHPLFGSGTDTFQLAFEHHRTAAYWTMEPGGAPHRAHNEILNIAATQGVFGLLCLGVLIYGVVATTKKHPPWFMPCFIAFSITSFLCFPVAATSLVAITLCAATYGRTNV